MLYIIITKFSTPWKFAPVGKGRLVKIAASVHAIMVKHMAISAHAGQNSELLLSAHGRLPRGWDTTVCTCRCRDHGGSRGWCSTFFRSMPYAKLGHFLHAESPLQNHFLHLLMHCTHIIHMIVYMCCQDLSFNKAERWKVQRANSDNY